MKHPHPLRAPAYGPFSLMPARARRSSAAARSFGAACRRSVQKTSCGPRCPSRLLRRRRAAFVSGRRDGGFGEGCCGACGAAASKERRAGPTSRCGGGSACDGGSGEGRGSGATVRGGGGGGSAGAGTAAAEAEAEAAVPPTLGAR